MEKKKQTTIQEINWKFTMLKVRYWGLEMEIKGALRRLFHCRKGHHHMMPKSLRIEKSMRTKKGMRCTLDLQWLECRDCGYSFFANLKDKKKWLNHFGRERRNFKKMMDFIDQAVEPNQEKVKIVFEEGSITSMGTPEDLMDMISNNLGDRIQEVGF